MKRINKKTGLVMFVALAAISALFSLTLTANAAELAAVGSTDPANGFPVWYQDAANRALQPCLTNDGNCTLSGGAYSGDPFNPANAISFPNNFPYVFYYYSAEARLTVGANNASLKFSLEGTFTTSPAVAGKQITYLRTNLTKMTGLVPNSTFTVTHPYGSFQFTTDASGNTVSVLGDQAYRAQDGCSAAPCDFTVLVPATTTALSAFLQWDPAVAPAAPAGYIGNPLAGHKVTGSPTGNNLVRLEGPVGSDLDGLGGNVVSTDVFYVSGKIYADHLTAAPASADFGPRISGTTSAVQTFTVTNSGTKNLTITAVNFSGDNTADYTVQAPVSGDCAFTPNLSVPPSPAVGSSCTISVAFSPQSGTNGVRTASFDITTFETFPPNLEAPPLKIALTGTADSTLPTVGTVLPANSATMVATNTSIKATFSEAMNSTTVSGVTFTLNGPSGAIAGTVTYDTVNKTATFQPAAAFATSATYTATITTGVQDPAGNAMAVNYTWTFDTFVPDVTPPTVQSVSPAGDSAGQALNTVIKATFSEPMDAASLNSSTFLVNGPAGAVSGVVTYDAATNIVSFTPLSNLPANITYTAIIMLSVKDLSGNTLTANYTWTFGTVDTVPPTVTGVTPKNATEDVAVTTVLTAVFAEAMDASTITSATFSLSSLAGAVTGTVSYDTATKTVTFTPSAALSSSAAYTATLTTGVKDVVGNAMTLNYSWSFSTQDAVPPVVSATSPVNNTAGVSLNGAVTAIFSEAMDPDTITGLTFALGNGVVAVVGTVSYDAGTNSATFTPTASLDPTTFYTATITTGAKDASGNSLTLSYLWGFTTGEAVDTTPPAVVSNTPENAATGAALTSSLTATFSEALSEPTVNSTTFIVTAGAAAVAGSVSYDTAKLTATFTPLKNFSAGQTYIVTITTGVRDTAGNAMAASHTWIFEAAAGTDISIVKTGTGTGSVVSTPDGINCGATCKYTYAGGQQLTLTAAPAEGSKFAGWSGGGCSGTGQCLVTLNADTTVSALFVTSSQVVLRVSKSGKGTGTVTVVPAADASCGSNCYVYELNPKTLAKKVKLTAKPDVGVKFVGWTGDISGTARKLLVTMQGNKTAIANFGEPAIEVSAVELDFGVAYISQTIAMPLVISNSGDAPLQIRGLSKAGVGARMFKLVDKKTGKQVLKGTTIPAGGNLDGEVRFRPSNDGLKAITLKIISDDPHTSAKTVHITGYCNYAASPKYQKASQDDLAALPVTREEMAVYIMDNLLYAFGQELPDDYCADGSPYADVASDRPSCKYLKRLQGLGAEGCDTGFCPEDPATREQMAVLVITALEGDPGDGYCDSGLPYGDIAPDGPSCKYIKRMHELGILSGCGAGFCPESHVSEDDLSAFSIWLEEK